LTNRHTSGNCLLKKHAVDALTEKVEQALGRFPNAPQEVLALCILPIELAQATSDRFLKKSVSRML
jgi:hypothetical protein